MPETTITKTGYRCIRCGWEWLPRREAVPTIGPKCKSPYWNREREAAGKAAHGAQERH